jgi:hypothetical protein
MIIPTNKIALGQGVDVSGLTSSNVGIDPATDVLGLAKILATASSTARTLETRFSEVVNAWDGVNDGTLNQPGMIPDGAFVGGNTIGGTMTGLNNTPMLQALVTYCFQSGKVLYIPPGYYYFNDPAGLDHYISIIAGGAGANTLMIKADPGSVWFLLGDAYDSTGASPPLANAAFFKTSNFDDTPTNTNRSLYQLFQIEGLGFQGRWSQLNLTLPVRASPDFSGWNGNGGRSCLQLSNFDQVRLNNIRAYDIRGAFSRSQICNSVSVTNSTFLRLARGSVMRFVDTPQLIEMGNLYRWCDDDPVNPTSSSQLVLPMPSQWISHGNEYEQCESFAYFGGKLCAVIGNTYKFSKSTPILAGGGDLKNSAGDTMSGLIAVVGNQVENSISRWQHNTVSPALFTYDNTNIDSAITLTSINMNSSTTGGILPGRATGVGGNVLDPTGVDSLNKPLAYNNGGLNQPPIVPNQSVPAGNGIICIGNTVIRTLPATADIDPNAKFSAYKFGPMFNQNGWVDPPVALNNFLPNGIRIRADIRNVTISSNVVSGLRIGSAVYFDYTGTAFTNSAFTNVVINDNIFHDCWTGINSSRRANGSAVNSSIKVHGNIFDMDPYMTQTGLDASGHPNATVAARTSSPINGSWRADVTAPQQPVGIAVTGMIGWDIQGNTFKNCYDAILPLSSLYDEANVLNNIVHCDPVAAEFSTSNKGVGFIRRGGSAWRPMVWYCDPTDATNFNNVQNICKVQSLTMPTTGKYVEGTIVWCEDLTLNILCWQRLTTNANHVYGTDWIAVPVASKINHQTTDYILALSDFGGIVEMRKNSAITLIIPASASPSFPIGTKIQVVQSGNGQVTVAGASGVSIKSLGNNTSLAGPWAVAELYKNDTNAWVLSGNLGPVLN